MHYNMQAMIGALHILCDSADNDLLGMAKADMIAMSNSVPWVGAQRGDMVRCIEQVAYGGMDAQGLGTVEVPAEFIAAAIYVAVSPVNYRQACKWTAQRNSADGIMDGMDDLVPPERLMTMIAAMRGHDEGVKGTMRERFERSIRKVAKRGVEDKTAA